MRGRILSAVSSYLPLCAALGGCSDLSSSGSADRPAALAAQPAAARYVAPITPFVAPQPWRSRRPDLAPVAPPDLMQHTWYAFVEQYEPHQIKTPVWQPLPAAEAAEIEMPPGGTIRCFAQPLKLEPDVNAFGTKLLGWVLSRNIVCSGDGWRSWTEYPHRVRLQPDGTRTVEYRSEGWLRERSADGGVQRSVLALRSEAPRREATTGPPQVLPGVDIVAD
jgi:hypothetical protein